MAIPPNHHPYPSTFTGAVGLDEPYHDDPNNMTSPQVNDSASPSLRPPPFNDSDAARPPHLTFRSTVGLLPTPGTVSKRHPTYEPLILRFWVVALGCVFLALLGVALEVARVISYDNDGFYVPTKNVFSFASAQFLTSFFPSLLFAPLALMVYGFDWAILIWHPYLRLSQGHASADETLLLNYVADSRPEIMYNALKFRHRFVLLSGFTALGSLLYQPLAGSIFSVRQLPKSSPSTVQSLRAIGLSPNINDLTAFASSAGFAEAAVYNGIGDPPFVFGGWATAEFVFPTNAYLNGTMGVNTTGIQTNVNCANPNNLSVVTSSANVSTVSATSVDGCSLQVSFNPANAQQQYGVVNVPNCGVGNSTDVALQPVFFWFWQQNPSNSAGVFCRPQIQLFDVTAFAFLNNNSLTNVTILDNYPAANNVSGSPLNNIPYNGLIFDDSADINVQSRANSIRTGIPNAIFRQAQQEPGGLASVFQDPKGFLGLTTHVYRQHLSLATKSNYFLPQNKTVNAVLTQLVPRLYIEPLPAHALATLCMMTAGVVLVLHFMHFRQRRDLYLAHPPGSIASGMALTSHSGFGDLLMPFDNQAALSRALAALRFCIDKRTGAIIVDDSAIAYGGEAPMPAIADETMMTLIGKGQQHQREDSAGPETPRET